MAHARLLLVNRRIDRRRQLVQPRRERTGHAAGQAQPRHAIALRRAVPKVSTSSTGLHVRTEVRALPRPGVLADPPRRRLCEGLPDLLQVAFDGNGVGDSETSTQ